ncbi:uncharacterized protein LOC112041322 [Lingula anatina]|uniref:Uncharacterized protein LOC112041322 n=1 Tax=Lingula anatina TaxID=7574 RepID=A0A2R2MIR4_LINAN|nr:uncharacterized protein LOC112041322 [Lingula anatina]|eukprot:XP_023930115.1 uncharacterized protein LOC112041322 [Lingula anatina]
MRCQWVLLIVVGVLWIVINGVIGVKKKVLDKDLQRETKPKGPVARGKLIEINNFTIVTGANHKYFSPALVNHVGSFCFWEPTLKIVVWDLGLTAKEVETVKSWSSVTYRRFPFERYPPHFRNLHTYAFKPVIIKQMVDELEAVLWVDAGSHISGRMKEIIISLFQKDGYVYSGLRGNGAVTKVAHPGMFTYFNITIGPYVGKGSISGNLNGWLRQGDIYEEILVPWVNMIILVGKNIGNILYDVILVR